MELKYLFCSCLLVPLALKIGAKGVHFFVLLVGGIGLLSIPFKQCRCSICNAQLK
jgi:hypothetical protein